MGNRVKIHPSSLQLNTVVLKSGFNAKNKIKSIMEPKQEETKFRHTEIQVSFQWQ